MIKDILQDIVAHTHSLGFISLVKITGTTTETKLESMSEERTCILMAKSHTPVLEFNGVFGMPNLEKLSLHLKNPEYQDNAKIEVVESERNGVTASSGLHFENESSDFQNDYRFMSQEMIEEKLKAITFKEPKWDVTFNPSISSISRLKLQAAANSTETLFQVRTENDNLIFAFGDASTHAGSFVFQANIGAKLKHTWAWPISPVQSILNLDGDITVQIADAGAMQITVNSGLIEYSYVLPAMTK
jgi:hypothetical protein